MALPATDPTTLMNLAKCFQCIPPHQQIPVQTYLLALLAGVDTSTPAAIAAIVKAAACFQCIEPGQQLFVQNYLLTQLLS